MSQRGDLSHYLDADWKSALQRKAFKIDLYQGNTRSWVLPSLSSVLSLEGIVTDTKGERQWSEHDTDLSESANSVGHSEVKITF